MALATSKVKNKNCGFDAKTFVWIKNMGDGLSFTESPFQLPNVDMFIPWKMALATSKVKNKNCGFDAKTFVWIKNMGNALFYTESPFQLPNVDMFIFPVCVTMESEAIHWISPAKLQWPVFMICRFVSPGELRSQTRSENKWNALWVCFFI